MKKLLATLLVLLSVGAYTLSPAEARHNRIFDNRGSFGYHPYIQKALIGGGIGAVAGGLLGRRDPVGAGLKGALLGSAAGVGYQYLRNSNSNNYGGNGGYYSGYNNSRQRFNGGGGGCGRGRHHGRGHNHHDDRDDD